jgi:hypothetical protein
MNRPCFLVIDREFPGSISTRKLVIETAKFNVLTAYSGKEAIEMITRFPAVSGVVLDGGLEDVPCDEVASKRCNRSFQSSSSRLRDLRDAQTPTFNSNPLIQPSYLKSFAT